MIEHILVEEVGLVDEEHGVHTLAAEVGDVGADRVEDRGRGGLGREPKRKAHVAVEVASTERDVVAVGQAKAGLGEAMAQRA